MALLTLVLGVTAATTLRKGERMWRAETAARQSALLPSPRSAAKGLPAGLGLPAEVTTPALGATTNAATPLSSGGNDTAAEAPPGSGHGILIGAFDHPAEIDAPARQVAPARLAARAAAAAAAAATGSSSRLTGRLLQASYINLTLTLRA